MEARLGAGLLAVGLTTLDVAMRPVDRLPEGEGTNLVEGIALAPAGTCTASSSAISTATTRPCGRTEVTLPTGTPRISTSNSADRPRTC